MTSVKATCALERLFFSAMDLTSATSPETLYESLFGAGQHMRRCVSRFRRHIFEMTSQLRQPKPDLSAAKR